MDRRFILVAWLCLGAILLSVCWRVSESDRLTTIAPGVQITSGCEYESFYSLWRVRHGETLYLDPTVPPFSAAYFNWLFYSTYAGWQKFTCKAGDEPCAIRAARHFSLVGAAIGLAALVWLVARALGTDTVWSRPDLLVIATYAFGGPMLGWWMLTVRPDIWALACETIGVVVVLAGYRRYSLFTALVAGVAFYAAWAFKQNYVQGILISGLFLASRRQWRCFVGLFATMTTGCLVTYISMDSAYHDAVSEAAASATFSLELGWANLKDALLKLSPLLILPTAVCWRLKPLQLNDAWTDVLKFSLIGIPCAIAMSLAFSSKHGAATNYYFTATVMLSLIVMAIQTSFAGRSLSYATIIALAALSVGATVKGTLHLRYQAKATAERWELWRQAPVPRYATDQSLNLPWLQPGAPVFLAAYEYGADRARGRPIAGDGIGGLIRRRYFAALLLPAELTTSFDGAPLDGYRRTAEKAGMALWLRNL